MSKYELCVVLSAKLEEEEKNAALERVKEFITRAGGSIRHTENMDDHTLITSLITH